MHCDIKVHNVLVFDSGVSTAESWSVKLSDFGNSILLANGSTSNQTVPDHIQGTPFYSPPEIDNASPNLTVGTVKAIDIWCWGLLMWQVVIGGGSFISEEGEEIDDSIMETLRRRNLVADTAWKSCSKYIRANHFNEQGTFRESIMKALQAALLVDPARRPCAGELCESLQKLLDEQ